MCFNKRLTLLTLEYPAGRGEPEITDSAEVWADVSEPGTVTKLQGLAAGADISLSADDVVEIMNGMSSLKLGHADIPINISGANAHIRNNSTSVVYAAKMPGVSAGADEVTPIPAGQSVSIRGIIGGAVYLLGTGSVYIQSDDIASSPFRNSAASGGSGADSVARAAIEAHAADTDIHVNAEEKAGWNGLPIRGSNPGHAD